MRVSLLRMGCAALSLSLTAGLLASCSLLPPASPRPDSKPAQAEPEQSDSSAALNDGKLRILYSNASNGGNTVLYGNTVVYQASSSETVYLVPDTLTGTARYYLRQWPDPSSSTGRVCALYDRSGKEVLTFDRAYDAALTGSLLVLTAPAEFAYDPAYHHAAGDCRVIDLATGEERTVPENAYNCKIIGDFLAFNVCALPEDYTAPENAWDEDLTPYYAVQVEDREGNVVYQAAGCSADTISASSSDGAAPTDWLVLNRYASDADDPSLGCVLYNPSTGEELQNYTQYTGTGTVCLNNDGCYQLVDLVSTEASTVLCEFAEPIRYYAPGAAVTEPENTASQNVRYTFHDLLTGEVKDLYDANTDDSTLAIYATDGTVQVFDLLSGALLTDTTLDPVDGQIKATVYPESNGWAWVNQYDNDNFQETLVQICSPEGVRKTLDPALLSDTYNYFFPLISTKEDVYFYGCYNGPGSSWLYDVLDSDGNVVVSGLRSCTSYYGNSANGLPEGVFAAVKGFRSGWMDVTGQWLYSESLFASAADETENIYF